MTDLAAIRERCAKATPGGWYIRPEKEPEDPGDLYIWATPNIHEIVATGMRARNADFIAHARQDVPDLLALVDSLTAQLADRQAKGDALLAAAKAQQQMRSHTKPKKLDEVLRWVENDELVDKMLAEAEAYWRAAAKE